MGTEGQWGWGAAGSGRVGVQVENKEEAGGNAAYVLGTGCVVGQLLQKICWKCPTHSMQNH